jgi:hypothetical protein
VAGSKEDTPNQQLSSAAGELSAFVTDRDKTQAESSAGRDEDRSRFQNFLEHFGTRGRFCVLLSD